MSQGVQETQDKPSGISREQLEELEEKYGDIGHLKSRRAGLWEVVFRPPSRPEMKMFRGSVHNPAKKADAQEMLGRAICVAVFYEGEATVNADAARVKFNRLLDRFPGICDSDACSSAFNRLMHDAVEEDSK